MEEKQNGGDNHVLVLPYPSQGHINPLFQLAKRLAYKGLKPSIAIVSYIAKSMPAEVGSIAIDSISDGFDETGFAGAASIEAYLETFRSVGSRTLLELIDQRKKLGHNICCLVYDAFLPWALDVAKEKGLYGAAFFTQACGIDAIYYHVYHAKFPSHVSAGTAVSLPGLPPFQVSDLPSFLSVPGSYPAYLSLVVNQYSNLEKADCVLINTFYKLEVEELNWMGGLFPAKAIGPTVPSMYLDKRIEDDKNYGLSLWKPDGEACMNWLNTQTGRSVVYVSFGSMAVLQVEQMEELAWGLHESGYHFLWVIRATEEQKLSAKFSDEVVRSSKGLIVRWAPQLEVLAHPAVGCFLTHCGWNSTVEALCMGVPMVGVPQWTDQPPNAKYVEEVWGVGVRVRVDGRGLVRRDEVGRCIKEVMEGESGEKMRKNASKWKDSAREAVDEGGSSDTSIDEFVKEIR